VLRGKEWINPNLTDFNGVNKGALQGLVDKNKQKEVKKKAEQKVEGKLKSPRQ
jgi:hypothetical protein